MTKNVLIKGMTCSHCSARVEKAFNKIAGVTATVNLATHTATLSSTKEIPNDLIIQAVDDAGYDVSDIAEQ